MKLSVRKKVANGLVIFLLMPKAAATANELYEAYSEGFAGFSADDDFDLAEDARSSDSATVQVKGETRLEQIDPSGGDPTGGDPTGGDPTGGDPTGGDPTGGDPTGGDPSGYDPSAFDPSGYDPSGGDPSGCDMATTSPPLTINAPRQLVTAEDGSADLFEVYMAADPPFPRTFRIVSTDPGEATPSPDAITLYDNACIPQSIWVTGQNDFVMDGDVPYTIQILDEQDFPVGQGIPGVNIDNDNYRGVAVDVLGPTSLPRGGSGLFLVRVANVSGENLEKSTLYIEPTDALEIKDYATALLSGQKFREKAKLKRGVLEFRNIRLDINDMLIVSVDVSLAENAEENQTVKARLLSDRSNEETDDDQAVRTAVP